MNKTHGDILYSPTTNGPTIDDLAYRPIVNTPATPRPNIMDYIRVEETNIPDDLGGGHPDPVGEQGAIGPIGIPHNSRPRGEVGWICPVCGRGLAPSTPYCPCNLTKNITYLNGGLSLQDIAIDCKSTPPEAHYTTATNTSK